ncbi:hypothetical protein [Chryseobacterium cheonjiense]|uniref:Immunity protein 35 domain-containing protein n=1 Tax=Chryseobacterium cheonjiense TaxID=2728845 RepID=A0A7Y0A3B0_9FLAO|nr:hypothetical protein [Chryseobacterium cheonjiense]NML55861.1 hypothetical protein [Chryseobacterium cheonjiense]
MNLTKEQALEIGIKVMQDIRFEYDAKDEIKVVYDQGKIYPNLNIWLIGFMYGKEDYGRNVGANLIINADTKLPKELLFRNGSITLSYDAEKDKYFVKSKRP